MTTATTLYERRHTVDRRIGKDRKVNEKPAIVTERAEVRPLSRERTHGLAFDILSAAVVVLIGIAVFSATGLLDGMTSMIGKIGLGGAIICSYLIMFRQGCYSRKDD